ncbi:MAG: hypothetical protein ACOYN6_03865, partial [Ignavibacteria bacterium]
KTFSYILIFSFLLTASGCYTTQSYSDPPEIFIAKEKENKGVKYDSIDSLTLINNKSVSLKDYTSKFIKSYTDSSYKFIYYFKTSVLDTIDIKNITSVNYTISTPDNDKTVHTVTHAFFIPLAILGVIFLFAAPKIFKQ